MTPGCRRAWLARGAAAAAALAIVGLVLYGALALLTDTGGRDGGGGV